MEQKNMSSTKDDQTKSGADAASAAGEKTLPAAEVPENASLEKPSGDENSASLKQTSAEEKAGSDCAGTADSAPGGTGRCAPKSLGEEKRISKRFLKEVRAEIKKHGGRISKSNRDAVESAIAALEEAMSGKSAEKIFTSRSSLENLAEKHLKFSADSGAGSYVTAILEALLIALAVRFFIVEPYKIPSGSMIPSLLIGDHIFISKLAYGIRIPALGKLAAHWGGYRRGDVIVFSNPLDDGLPILKQRDYVKRIIGLPGDRVELEGETVLINGIPQVRTSVDQNYLYYDRRPDTGTWFRRNAELLEESLDQGPAAEGEESAVKKHPVLRDPLREHDWREGPFIVPPGHLFVLGDNRDNSQDGRYGPNGGWYVPFDHVKGKALIIWFSWGESGIRFSRLGTGF